MCLMRGRSTTIIASLVTLLAGCYTTTTKPQLDEKVQRMQGNTLQGKLILEGSDANYDYYRIDPGAAHYRVPRSPDGT
jgi:hypothetical protein